MSLELVTRHAMGVCSDPHLVAELRCTQPGSREAATVIGRILSSYPASVEEGSPLVHWVSNRPVRERWEQEPQRGSLMAQLDFLCTVHGRTYHEDGAFETWSELNSLGLN